MVHPVLSTPGVHVLWFTLYYLLLEFMYSGTPSTIYSWSSCILVYPVLSTPRVHVFWYTQYYLLLKYMYSGKPCKIYSRISCNSGKPSTIFSLSTCILVYPVLSTLRVQVFSYTLVDICPGPWCPC